MEIQNLFIDSRKNLKKKDMRFSHMSEITKSNPLKTLSKKIINSYTKFGFDYFDNKNIGVGYGGYKHDNRFKIPVKKIIKYFNLPKKSKVLDVGCAKGFLLAEFQKHFFDVYGAETSNYAIKNSLPFIKKNIYKKNLCKTPFFKKKFFDFIICKDMLPHLSKNEIKKLIININHVAKNTNNIYLVIHIPRSNDYKKNYKNWDITHKTIMTKNEWLIFLKSNNFLGKISFKELV